nr:DUF523 domain-containing protein [Pseudoalteromonas sp. T1lg10]
MLVSACLLGNKVRYNASCLSVPESDLNWLQTGVELVVCCPEVSAGLPIPRAPAEIIAGQGVDVLQGAAVLWAMMVLMSLISLLLAPKMR